MLPLRTILSVALVAVFAAALAAGPTIADAAPKRAGVTPDLIVSAIAVLGFNHAPEDWTKSGKPKVAAIERVLDADISAADRDGAWDAYRAGPSDSELAAQARAAAQDRDAALVEINDLRHTLQDARDSSRGWQARAERAEGAIAEVRSGARAVKDRYEGMMAAAESDRDAASRLRREARSVLAEAEARERGAGPPAGRGCRKALRGVVIDADVGWLSGNVKVDEKGRAALARACLFASDR